MDARVPFGFCPASVTVDVQNVSNCEVEDWAALFNEVKTIPHTSGTYDFCVGIEQSPFENNALTYRWEYDASGAPDTITLTVFIGPNFEIKTEWVINLAVGAPLSGSLSPPDKVSVCPTNATDTTGALLNYLIEF